MEIDLRKLTKNDTYIINLISVYSAFNVIYHFDGVVFNRVLYSGDRLIYHFLKKTLTPKEFKKILKNIDDKNIIYHYYKRE